MANEQTVGVSKVVSFDTGRLAQSAELGTHNSLVTGSSPVPPTTNFSGGSARSSRGVPPCVECADSESMQPCEACPHGTWLFSQQKG